ncbi:cellulose binding domain-containing protein [Lentzea sp. NPDC051213]|uniref:cellulose binding domain-containing protein n=1 Tax=Lentzea sp. NPDC051213 TaxID=3364126 RepID=UPI0037956D9F
MRLFDRHRPILYTPAAVLIVAACATGSADTAPTGAADSTPQLPPITLLPPPPDKVEEVVDARTVVLSTGTRARVLGLAAPGECYSGAAVKFARDTLLGKQVHYSRASESLISLRLPNNDDYAALAVSKGALRAEKDDPVLTEVEKSAAQAGLGLWGPPCQGHDTTPTHPAPAPPPVTSTPPPAAAKDCAVTYRVAKEWAGGFHVELIVRNNTRTPATRWTVHWKFPSGQRIGETWGMTARQYGADVIAMSPDGNGSISAGGQVSLRFNAAGPTAAPTAFELNGKSCSLG